VADGGSSEQQTAVWEGAGLAGRGCGYWPTKWETRRAGVMRVMDDINRRGGRDTLRYLAEGLGQPWWMRRERLSPAYTTRWTDLLGVA
jgi:hypothetical protein